MGRMPYHVQIFPYRMEEGRPRYCLFQRADIPSVWQGVCGGGEEGESIVETALRECGEEAGIEFPGPLYPLDSVSVMRSSVFPQDCLRWGRDVVVLPMYFFAMAYEGPVRISEEHLQYRWVDWEEGNRLVRVPDQNTALWELQQRLERDNVFRPIFPFMTERWKGFPTP